MISTYEKILGILNNNPPPQVTKLNLRVGERCLYVSEQVDKWSPASGEDFLSKTLNKSANYSFDCKKFESTFIPDNIFQDFKSNVVSTSNQILFKTSYNKNPKMTNLCKSFYKIFDFVRYNRSLRNLSNDDRNAILDALIKICDYYLTVTKEHDIRSDENKVHRKNIYSLFTLMEKKYGTKEN